MVWIAALSVFYIVLTIYLQRQTKQREKAAKNGEIEAKFTHGHTSSDLSGIETTKRIQHQIKSTELHTKIDNKKENMIRNGRTENKTKCVHENELRDVVKNILQRSGNIEESDSFRLIPNSEVHMLIK